MSNQQLPPKRFNLSYDFTGGHRDLSFTTLFEFYEKLSEVMEDANVIQSTVSFYTDRKK